MEFKVNWTVWAIKGMAFYLHRFDNYDDALKYWQNFKKCWFGGVTSHAVIVKGVPNDAN